MSSEHINTTAREALGRLIRRVQADQGYSDSQLAEWLGVCVRSVGKARLGRYPISLERLRLIPEEGAALRHALMDWAGEPYGERIALREEVEPGEWSIQSVVALADTAGSSIAQLGQALADGRIDAEEAEELDAHLERTAQVIAELRAKCKRVRETRSEVVQLTGRPS